MRKTIAVCIFCIFLSGCAGLTTLLSTLGGGTATKGHGNDNEANIGSDVVKGVSSGTKSDIDSEHNSGTISGRDTSADKVTGNKVVNHDSDFSWQDWVVIALLVWFGADNIYRFQHWLFNRKKNK